MPPCTGFSRYPDSTVRQPPGSSSSSAALFFCCCSSPVFSGFDLCPPTWASPMSRIFVSTAVGSTALSLPAFFSFAAAAAAAVAAVAAVAAAAAALLRHRSRGFPASTAAQPWMLARYAAFDNPAADPGRRAGLFFPRSDARATRAASFSRRLRRSCDSSSTTPTTAAPQTQLAHI